jgi:succinate dehydrogenase cytochrome b556 subunit
MAEMAIKKKRPKNLDLPTIRLPLPGILSIIHRISGAALFLLLPLPFMAVREQSDLGGDLCQLQGGG